MQQTITRYYTGSPQSMQRQFEADRMRLEGQGYEVISQTVIPGRRGCLKTGLGILTLGIFLLLFKPKDQLMVVYRRVPVVPEPPPPS